MTHFNKIYRTHQQLQSSKKLSKNIQHPATTPEVQLLYKQYLKGQCLSKQTKLLWRLLKTCYRNKQNQSILAKLLKVPFQRGPISINELTTHLLAHDQQIQRGLDETSQLEFLFDYLKNVRDPYLCWIIYFNEELGVLNVKLLREDQLQDYQDLFDPNINLIGLFLQPQVPRPRALSPLFSQARSKSHICKLSPDHSTGNSWKTATTTKERQGSKCQWKRSIKKRNGKKGFANNCYFDC